jgi:hypothetical protein
VLKRICLLFYRQPLQSHVLRCQPTQAGEDALTYPDMLVLCGREANAGLYPHGPCRQAVYKKQGKVGEAGAAVPLDLPGPAPAAHGS